MRRLQLFAGLSVAFLVFAVAAIIRQGDVGDGARVLSRGEDADGNGTLRMLSKPYELDKAYESMQGRVVTRLDFSCLKKPKPTIRFG